VIAGLELWVDETARPGPENMAVDEWLLQTVSRPVLRVYRWEEAWGSCGYFVAAAEVRSALPGLRWVRRWTGGGIVDHRADWTYTVVLPRTESLAQCRGAESYRVIHGALVAALAMPGVVLAGESVPARGGVCFSHAVEHDVVDATGRKIAGAGQRRTSQGLLHQGSLSMPAHEELAQCMARELAREVRDADFRPPAEFISERVASRYGAHSWQERR
jgi:lipoate-protein ligase A